jgi:hypothetical protein
MPEEVVEKTVPQQQPGPERTPDGTIKDQSPAPEVKTNLDGTPIQQASSTSKDSLSTEKTEDKSEDKSEPVLTGAPEKYEDFKLPEGFKLDPEAVTAATEIFKKANLSQDGAQQLIDFHAKQLQAAQEAPFKAFVDMKKEWTDTVNTKYGKDIAEGGKHFVAVGGLLEKLGDAEAPFREAMDATGVGSHPAFVAAFIKLAEMLGSGTHVKGNGPSPLGQSDPSKGGEKTLAQKMYPHLQSSNS